MKKIKTAFVLGAGLGTRLRPLTETCPKPLIELNGKPMIVYVFEQLQKVGVERFIVNTHHCSERYDAVFPGNSWEGIPITFSHEPELLGTGGGLKKIQELVGEETFLMQSGDVVTDLPLQKLIDSHFEYGAEVTMALRSAPEPRTVGIDEKGYVRDISKQRDMLEMEYYNFANVSIIEPNFFSRIPSTAPSSVASFWLEMAREKLSIRGIVLDEGYWYNVGTPDEYEKVNQQLEDLIKSK